MPEQLPHITVGHPPSARLRLFPDGLPIGVESNGRAVFLYLATTSVDGDLRAVVQRHGDLFRALPEWTLRLLVLRRTAGVMGSFEAAVRDELAAWSPRTVEEFTWYCEQRGTTSDPRARCQSDERFRRAHRAFSTPRGQRLYHRWLTDGDTVFEGVSSTAITVALARGTARIEAQVLLPSYQLEQCRIERMIAGLNDDARMASRQFLNVSLEGHCSVSSSVLWTAATIRLCYWSRETQSRGLFGA